MKYTLVIEPMPEEDGGGFVAFFPDLPGCISDGETPVEALENAKDALMCWIEAQTEREVAIPEPGDASQHFAAYMDAMQNELKKLSDELQAARNVISELERAGAHRWHLRGMGPYRGGQPDKEKYAVA